MQDLQKKHLQPKKDVYDESKTMPLKTHSQKSRDKLTKLEKSAKVKTTETKKEEQE